MMIQIDQKTIDNLIEQARTSPRKRKNLNFHPQLSDPLQRMLHAMEPETYVQPHKHENPDKREAFIILKGTVAALEFSPLGELKSWFVLNANRGNFGAEFAPGTWHCLIALEPASVVYEVKDGPWDPADDKYFAPWAPREGDPECENYKKSLLKQMGIK
jgi:cupin fold WbuC family metalloprotein